MHDRQEALRQHVLNASVQDPPPSWERHRSFGVGGLLAVGFGENERYLLVESSNGRGVFDCVALERVARDYDMDAHTWSDLNRLECDGIGPLEGQSVRMAGLYGGGLSRGTGDGWSVDLVQIPWPDEYLVVAPPDSSIYDLSTNITRLRPPFTAVHAFGFSPSGRTLVLATSSDLTIYDRDL